MTLPEKACLSGRTVKKLIRGLEAVEDWARRVLIGLNFSRRGDQRASQERQMAGRLFW